jgi:type IV pilus assembly protein PilO
MAAAKKSGLEKLSLPGRIAIGLVILALPLVVYFVIFHSELQAKITSAQNTSLRLDAELKQAKAAEHAYQEDLQELAERERNRRELMKILPETTEYPAFLSSIQNVANLVGVELRGWTPQEEVPEEFYARVPMKLELAGRFHQLAKFFYYVGQSERIINMENIALTDPKKKDGEIRLGAHVLATAFHAVVEGDGAEDTKSRKRRDVK